MMHINNNYKKLLLTVKKFSDDFMNERTQPKIEKRPFFLLDDNKKKNHAKHNTKKDKQ